MTKQTLKTIERMRHAGLSFQDALALRRIERTLHRWAELQCGDGNNYASWAIERDEATGKPFMVTYPHDGKSYRRAIPDKEKGALKRLAVIMARYPALVAYQQTDPRGCALYIVPVDVLQGRSLETCYTSGIAVAS